MTHGLLKLAFIFRREFDAKCTVSCLSYRSKDDLLGILDNALAGAIGALVPGAFGQLLQALAGENVAAGQDHGGVGVCGLAPADGADEDGVVEHALWEGGLEGQLVLCGPLRVLGPVDAGPLDEVREGEGAGRCGDVEGGFGGEAQQRAELAREGRGHLVEGKGDVEDGAVRRVGEVG